MVPESSPTIKVPFSERGARPTTSPARRSCDPRNTARGVVPAEHSAPRAVPYKVLVATKEGTPVTAVARTPADCEPKAVTLEPEEVTAPLMFAFVVTVAACRRC